MDYGNGANLTQSEGTDKWRFPQQLLHLLHQGLERGSRLFQHRPDTFQFRQGAGTNRADETPPKRSGNQGTDSEVRTFQMGLPPPVLSPAPMADVFSKKKRSEVMAAIRSRGNKDTELKLAALLRAWGIKGWRRHQSLPGKPDFVFKRARLAVFVDGCFWHGCRWHCRMPKSRKHFWEPKIARNKARDREVARLLRASRWKVLRFWEHSLRSPSDIVRRLRAMLATPPPEW